MAKVERNMKNRPPAAAYALLLVAECMIWGFSNAFSKLAFDEITPIWCLVIRYFLSFFLFLAAFGRRFFREFRREDLKPCVIVSLFTAAAFLLGFVSLAHTSATNSGFLMSLAVVFAPLLAIPIVGTRFQWRLLLPVAVAAAGLFVFSGGSLTSLRFGDMLAILCSVASALMLVTSSKYLRKTDPVVLCVTQCAVCFFVCLPAALAFEPLPDIAGFSPVVWQVIALLSFGCTFLAYYFQNTALARVSATFGAMVFSTEPIFTAISAYFLLGERMGPWGFAGAALILGGISLAGVFEGQSKGGAADGASFE